MDKNQKKELVKKICTYDDGKSTDRLEIAFKFFLETYDFMDNQSA